MGAATLRDKGLIFGLALAMAAGAALLGGCKDQPNTPQQMAEDLRTELARKLPQTWAIAYARDIKFPLQKPYAEGDLVIYHKEQVTLQPRKPSTQPTVEPIYYILSVQPFIETARYAEVWRKNETVRSQHERVLHSVKNVARDADGKLMPRGDTEDLQVAAFKEEYAKLPPYDRDIPGHYYDGIGIKIRDYRGIFLPESRDLQQEMNTVYVTILSNLRLYQP